MWWGGFSEENVRILMASNRGLNPHVVGRFFRDEFTSETIEYHVLIPMWWGGFSEQKQKQPLVVLFSLNPHVVGRFFRVVIHQSLNLEQMS